MNTLSVAAPAVHGKSRKARLLYRGLDAVNFDHDAREDEQQVFMEQLELVATGLGLKPVFVAGQSSHDHRFLRELEGYAETHGLLACRVENLSVNAQLLAGRYDDLSPSALRCLVEVDHPKLCEDEAVLCLYRSPDVGEHIHECLCGQRCWGEALGYPACCATDYLALEGKLSAALIAALARVYSPKDEAELAELYRRQVPLDARYEAEVRPVVRQIQSRQATSIRKFPFIHYIACERCLNDPTSAAAQQNRAMSDLASDLSSTFARKFTDYARSYYEQFLQSF